MVLKSRTGRYLPWVCVALFGGAVLRTHPEWILSSLAQPTAGDGPAAPNDVPAAADNPAYQKYYQQFLSQGYDAQTAATYAQQHAPPPPPPPAAALIAIGADPTVSPRSTPPSRALCLCTFLCTPASCGASDPP